MYLGHVFLCSTESLNDCLKHKRFTCSGDSVQAAQEMEAGSVVFLLNTRSNTLIGPFTTVGSAKTNLEPGAWTEVADAHSFSTNIRVEWEEVHEMKNPQDKFSFLKEPKICKLSHFQTQDLLKALEQAPLYHPE